VSASLRLPPDLHASPARAAAGLSFKRVLYSRSAAPAVEHARPAARPVVQVRVVMAALPLERPGKPEPAVDAEGAQGHQRRPLRYLAFRAISTR
jgi:hypothetical protein